MSHAFQFPIDFTILNANQTFGSFGVCLCHVSRLDTIHIDYPLDAIGLTLEFSNNQNSYVYLD